MYGRRYLTCTVCHSSFITQLDSNWPRLARENTACPVKIGGVQFRWDRLNIPQTLILMGLVVSTLMQGTVHCVHKILALLQKVASLHALG